MEMYKKVGEFTPDSLIVSPDFPILKEGIGLKAGYGVLKRGSLIMKGEDKAGYIAGTVITVEKTVTVPAGEEGQEPTTTTEDVEMKMIPFGILADDTDTGTDDDADNIPAVAYQSGEFNREAVIVSGDDVTIDDYEDDLRGYNIYLRNVQKY